MALYGSGTPQNPAQGSLSPSIIVISKSAIQGVALPIRQRLPSASINRQPKQPPHPHPSQHPLHSRPTPAHPNTSLSDARSRLRCSRTLLQGVNNHLDTGRTPSTHPPQHDHCLSALRVAQRSHQSSAAQWRCHPPIPTSPILHRRHHVLAQNSYPRPFCDSPSNHRVKKSLLERTYSVATASPPPATRNTCRTCVSAIGLPVSQSTGSSIARGERDVAR